MKTISKKSFLIPAVVLVGVLFIAASFTGPGPKEPTPKETGRPK
jgi:hypothetical protein